MCTGIIKMCTGTEKCALEWAKCAFHQKLAKIKTTSKPSNSTITHGKPFSITLEKNYVHSDFLKIF